MVESEWKGFYFPDGSFYTDLHNFCLKSKRNKLQSLYDLQEKTDRKYERQIAVVMATPIWAAFGPYCVDHIVPLKGITPDGYLVSGLNVEWNLQIMTLEANSRKRNRMSKRDYEIACSLERGAK